MLKAYIRNVANKAERVIRVVGALGGTISRVRGSALRPMYLGYARTVMGYGYEVCLTGDVDLIKNLVSIQYETLHESGWGLARAPQQHGREGDCGSAVKDTRLKHVFELKLTIMRQRLPWVGTIEGLW